jgi:hypothetical protein
MLQFSCNQHTELPLSVQHGLCLQVEGSYAQQKARVAGLNQQLASSAALPGDVLRAVTATNFV